MIFSRSHAWMEELDYKDSWGPNKYCFWTVVLENILERPLECKKIKPVNPKGNKSWIFIWRTHAEAETLILWPYDVKKWLIGKDPDAGNDRRWYGWMASLTWWTWGWTSPGHWWWTGKPGVLQSMWSQRIRHDWLTKMTYVPNVETIY